MVCFRILLDVIAYDCVGMVTPQERGKAKCLLNRVVGLAPEVAAHEVVHGHVTVVTAMQFLGLSGPPPGPPQLLKTARLGLPAFTRIIPAMRPHPVVGAAKVVKGIAVDPRVVGFRRQPLSTGVHVAVPLGTGDEPDHSEPIGAALSLLAALFDSRIEAVLARGGLVSMRSVRDSQFVHVPHDFVIPGVLTVRDLPDVAAALGSASVRVDGLVDGANRPASSELVRTEWDVLLRQDASALVSSEPTDDCTAWLIAALNRGE